MSYLVKLNYSLSCLPSTKNLNLTFGKNFIYSYPNFCSLYMMVPTLLVQWIIELVVYESDLESFSEISTIKALD